MRASSSQAGLAPSDIEEIISYVRIAELHGSHLSLTDALSLTSSEMSEEELAAAWTLSEGLLSEYPLYRGRIVSRRELSEQGHGAIQARIEAGRRRAEANMRVARAVGKIFARDGLRLFSVSGGNSYDFARPGDDIDLFCVTKTNCLWRFILKQLFVCRFYGTFRKDLPRLCFNYALDAENSLREFVSPQDRLFARDALSVKVIAGHDFFDSLVGEARWMEGWFPKVYKASARSSDSQPPREKDSRWSRVLNMLLYRMIGPYIRLKSIRDNAENRRAGRVQLQNRLMMGEGYLLYESRKYQALRRIYEHTDGR